MCLKLYGFVYYIGILFIWVFDVLSESNTSKINIIIIRLLSCHGEIQSSLL